MFGCFYKNSVIPPIDPIVLNINNASDPLEKNIGTGMYTHINGNFNKLNNNYYLYDETQEPSYDPEGETYQYEYSFKLLSKSFKQFIADIALSDENSIVIEKIYINGVESSLTGNDMLYYLQLSHEWEGPIPYYATLYYNLSNFVGSYVKNDLKIVWHDVEDLQTSWEYEIDPNDSYFMDIFGKTYAQLPSTITVTAIQ